MNHQAIQILRESCEKAHAMGWKLRCGAFNNTINPIQKCCCVFGAVIVARGSELPELPGDAMHAMAAAKSLGFSEQEAWDIISSFDTPVSFPNDNGYKKLGIELRAKYDPDCEYLK